MSSAPATRVTPEEYLERERHAEHKSEYFQGEVFAVAGASSEHVLIVTNLIIALGNRLKGRGCKVYSNDLRLSVNATGLYTYPDVMVVCGQAAFADKQRYTLLNPAVIIEVLSDSTKDYDRGGKFQHYRTLSSLVEYLTVAQHTVHVEHYTRQPDHRWILSDVDNLGSVLSLTSIGVELPLSEVYAEIELA